MVGKEVAIEIKNAAVLTGTLNSVDQYLNVKLSDADVVEAKSFEKNPIMSLMKIIKNIYSHWNWQDSTLSRLRPKLPILIKYFFLNLNHS